MPSAGKERAASEAADLLYHAMVLMNVQASSYFAVPFTYALHCMGRAWAARWVS